MKKFLAIILLVFICGLFIAARHSKAVNSPFLISNSSNESLAPTIVTDSNGKVHVVWMDAANGWSSSTTSLMHSFWNGDVWSTPASIFSGNFHELPSLAADTSGNVHLSWDADTNPDAWQIYYSKYNGTSWSAATAISGSTSGDVAWDSEITIDSSGNPHVAYTFIPAGTIGNQRFTYYTRWNGSSWTSPVNVTESGTFHQYPTIGADTQGQVHVVWKNTASDNSNYQILHRLWNGSSFGTTNVPSGTVNEINEAEPRIAVDGTNNAHVIWEEKISETSDFSIKYSKWNGSSWSSPFEISAVGHESSQGVPSVAVLKSAIDHVIVGWIDKSVSPLKLGFRKFDASAGQWLISRTNDINQTSADFPVAAMDKWDNVHVAWGEKDAATLKYKLYYDAIPLAINEIGSTGGSLTTFNNDTLTIPSGSLSQNTLISAQLAPLSQAIPEGSVTVPRQYIFEPTGQTFNPAIQIVFRYTDAELSAGNESTLGVYVWDSTTSQWVFKTGVVNKGQNTLTINLDHFSIYGLFATVDAVDWIAPLKEDEMNEVKQGKTIPVKFKLNIEEIKIEDLKLQVLNEQAQTVAVYTSSGIGKEQLRYNEDSQQFMVNLTSQDFSPGLYQIKVIYQGFPKSSVDVLISSDITQQHRPSR